VVRVPESAPDHIERRAGTAHRPRIAGNLVTMRRSPRLPSNTMPLFTRPTRISSVLGPAMAQPTHRRRTDTLTPTSLNHRTQHALPCASLG